MGRPVHRLRLTTKETEMNIAGWLDMRRLLAILALAAGLSAPVLAAETAAAAKTPELDRAQVDALLAKPERVIVLDVRRPDEQQSKGSFPVFLSIQAADLEKYLAYIPRDRQVITVSNHAARAKKAGDLLTSRGFKVAGAAGVETYESQGGTLLKVAPPAPKPNP
jgi:rhodanese-related sulfurtransferase